MKLEQYLKENDKAVADFADEISTSRQAVYSYVRGEKIPSADTMAKIYQVTGGLVSPNDFYDLEGEQTA